MRGLGWTECDVAELEVSDLEETALGIALNRTSELAAWDDQVLSRLLAELRDADALDGSGFSNDDLDELLAELEGDTGAVEEDDGPNEPATVAVSQRGDLWHLGEHRLLCGDATLPADVARLMDGEEAALCATDPPYCIDYTGDRPKDAGKDWIDTYREIDISDPEAFFRETFRRVLDVLAPRAAIYCWHASKRSGLLQQVWSELGILDRQQVIWVKPSAVFGRSYWHYRHEPCLMGWRQGQQPEHDGIHEHDSVWEIDWNGKARIQADHPTSKPVELFARPMRKHTRVDSRVGDARQPSWQPAPSRHQRSNATLGLGTLPSNSSKSLMGGETCVQS